MPTYTIMPGQAGLAEGRPECLCRALTTYYFVRQGNDIDGRLKPGHDD